MFIFEHPPNVAFIDSFDHDDERGGANNNVHAIDVFAWQKCVVGDVFNLKRLHVIMNTSIDKHHYCQHNLYFIHCSFIVHL